VSEAINSIEKTEAPGRPLIAFAGLILLVNWLYFLFPFVRFQFWQSDTFWLIEIGRRIIETHSLPTHDLYSYTATSPHWTVYQWLTEVLFSMANDIYGLTGVAIFGEIVLAILFCVLMVRRFLKQGIIPAAAIVSAWASAYSFFPDLTALRPQLISFVLFWCLSAVCNDCKQKMSPAQAIKLTFFIAVVWANCHVSFPMGILLLGVNLVIALVSYLFDKTSKKRPKMFALMLVAFFVGTLCTPHGIALYWFLVSLRNLIPIQELMPLTWQNEKFLGGYCVLSFIAAIIMRKKIDIADKTLLASLFLTGSNCGRLIVYFCLFSSSFNAMALNRILSPLLSIEFFKRLNKAAENVIFSGVYVPAILVMSTWVVINQPLYIPHRVPLKAVHFLLTHKMAGNLFCTSHAGSYLIYSSRGLIPVFLDTRMDLYNEDFCYLFSKALNDAEGWRELFAKYKIAEAILPNNTKLRSVLEEDGGWKPVYRDDDFSIYVSANQTTN